jgi:hypothetical protein
MALIFYPHEEDGQNGTHEERIAVLLDAAEHYKAAVLEIKVNPSQNPDKRTSPVEMEHAFNWPEIASMLQEIRELPEANENDKSKKAALLNSLAGVYEVLRGAKMSKLEAVRMALVGEAKLLGGKGEAGVTTG